MLIHVKHLSLALALGLGLGACSEDAPATAQGSYAITIYGEEFIEDQIPAADTDGWQIKFDKFLIGVDQVQARGVEAPGAYAYDLSVSSSGEGHELYNVDGIAVGAIKPLSYRVSPLTNITGGNAAEADRKLLTDNQASIYVAGSATKGDVTKTFAWSFKTTTAYGPCETTAVVSTEGTAVSQLTIHADHFFYDDLVSEEPNVAFELIASADADDDGQVTQAELEAVDITAQDRYQVGSNTQVKNLWQFINAQTATLGHIDGEGHCELQ